MSSASNDNPQFNFFDGRDSNWDADALDLMVSKNVNPSFLNAGESENNQLNDNGPNACFIGCYNVLKANWMSYFVLYNLHQHMLMPWYMTYVNYLYCDQRQSL